MASKIQSLSQYIDQYTEHINGKWKQYISKVKSKNGDDFPRDGREIEKAQTAWFRGQPVDEPLRPKAFRTKAIDETTAVLSFRRRALAIAVNAPDLYEYDEWLFLMQHHGLSTRLLDWSESPLVALFFAVNQYERFAHFDRLERFNPVVWMLNPHVFNWMFSGSSILLPTGRDEVGESGSGDNQSQEGLMNIRGAFTRNRFGIPSPLAIEAKLIHRRMHAQRSCFTVHGKDHRSMEEIFHDTDLLKMEYLKKIEIDEGRAEDIMAQLRQAGITDSMLFPDLEGLARDIDAK